MSGTVAINKQTGDVLVLSPEGQWQPPRIAENPQTKERLFYDGKGWQPMPAPTQPRGFGRVVDDVGRAVAQGVTFGFADELAAGANAAVGSLTGQPGTFGERYSQGLEAERARDREFQAAAPIASTALQIGGTLANPLSRLGVGGGLLRQMGGNAAVGGALGAVTGFGEGEGGFGQRALSAGLGGATGAAFGGAVPLIATALAKGARAAGGWMGLGNPATDAERMLTQAIKGDVAAGGDDLPALATKLREMPGNQPMILPDVAGDSTMGLAQAVSREPGAGRAIARTTVNERGGLNQSARLTDAVKRGISADDFLASKDDLLRTRATTAAPKYEAAFSRIIPTADEAAKVERFIKDPIGQDALQKGLRVIELENLAAGTKFDPKAYGVVKGEDGKFILEPDRVPTLRLMDAVKRGYDEIVEGFRNDYGVLQLNQYGRAVNNARAVYRNELGDMYPRYGDALKAWSGPSQSLDAMNLGRRVLTGDADETAAVIAKMPPGDKDMFRIGVARALIDKVKSAGDTHDITKARNLWGSEAVRERVAAAFDDPAQFREFSDFMARELKMAETNAVINPRAGSQTNPLAAQRGQGAPAGPMLAALVSALRGDGLGAGANVLRSVGALGQPTTAQYAELAPMLFAMKPGDRARVIDRLLARETTDEARAAMARALAGGVRGAATSTGVQLQND